MSREMRELELKKSVMFRGQRMSSSERRAMASGGAIRVGSSVVRTDAQQGALPSASRPGAVRGSKPSTAKLRKAGVVVPRAAGLKRADRLAKRRAKIASRRR